VGKEGGRKEGGREGGRKGGREWEMGMLQGIRHRDSKDEKELEDSEVEKEG